MSTAEKVTLVSTGLGIVVLLGGFRRWAWPRWRAFWRLLLAALVSLGGRDAIEDTVTGQWLPAVPPLHVRLSGIEQDVGAIQRAQEQQAKTLGILAEVQAAQETQTKAHLELYRTVADHEARLISLEDVGAERAAIREETTALLRAVADKDVLDIEGDER